MNKIFEFKGSLKLVVFFCPHGKGDKRFEI
jgi:hypothetical protein